MNTLEEIPYLYGKPSKALNIDLIIRTIVTNGIHKENTVKDKISELFPPWFQIEPLKLIDYESDLFLNLYFTVPELFFVLNKFRIKSSSGLDDIDYKIIKALPAEGLNFLLEP